MKKLLKRFARPKFILAASVAWMASLVFAGGWLFWWLLPPLDPAPYLQTTASGRLLDRSGAPLYVALDRADNWAMPQSYATLSPFLIQATQAVEDQRFWTHYGVDPIAILRAAGQNVWHGVVSSGASTLTMQLVKLGGHDSRSVTGKLDQAVRALRLEKAASKEDILTAYLNRAPYGMNLIGAEAAAWRYFGKSAQTLSLPEAALLAGLPKAPSWLNPLAHPERARVRRDYVLRRMHAEGFIDAAQRDWALAAAPGVIWHDFPRLAPHLAVPFAADLRAGAAVMLTLGRDLQQRLEAYLPHYLKRFNGTITNGAILVADVASGEMLARVGSADFDYTPGGGQVDACRAARSPGSTLKPFLYGLAMEKQQLYPSEVLLDDVLDYGGYNPGNFDGKFNGTVTATEALRYSLNVPAVALLGRVGVPDFRDWLRAAGLDTVYRSAEDYGLGLALGNCEVQLDELARLYLSIASLGGHNELRLRRDAPATPQTPVLPPDICRALYAMLAQPFPEDLSGGLIKTGGNATPVCWKTGTSTGYHDAWTFAFNQHYLVAVWLGNNSGADARQLVGARAALPLAAKIFRELPPKSTPAWPPAATTDTPVRICARSGLPAGDACPETATVLLSETFWRHRRCTLHPTSQADVAMLGERPAGPARWDLAALAARRDPGGGGSAAPRALGITVPANGAEYVMSGVDGGDRLRLTTSLGESESLYWYVDDHYLGQSGPVSPAYWTLAPGEHRVTCVAPDGATATVRFTAVRPSAGIAVQ